MKPTQVSLEFKHPEDAAWTIWAIRQINNGRRSPVMVGIVSDALNRGRIVSPFTDQQIERLRDGLPID